MVIPWRNRSILAVDCAGAAIAICLVAGALWYGLYHLSRSSSRIAQLSVRNADARSMLNDLGRAIDRQEDKAGSLDVELQQRGRLPATIPVEDNLNTIAQLARIHNVQVLGVAPRSSIRYPTLFEARYGMMCAGTYHDLVGLLYDIEQSDIWGDVSFLQVKTQPSHTAGDLDDLRAADLTLSFYSSAGNDGAHPVGTEQ